MLKILSLNFYENWIIMCSDSCFNFLVQHPLADVLSSHLQLNIATTMVWLIQDQLCVALKGHATPLHCFCFVWNSFVTGHPLLSSRPLQVLGKLHLQSARMKDCYPVACSLNRLCWEAPFPPAGAGPPAPVSLLITLICTLALGVYQAKTFPGRTACCMPKA